MKLHFGNTPWAPSQQMNARPTICSGTRTCSGSPAQRRSNASRDRGSIIEVAASSLRSTPRSKDTLLVT